MLVHGVASSADTWDITAGFSVARELARRGFVVIAYDRLGFARSTYDRPRGGNLATTPNQRDVLHQVVDEVKTAGYDVASGAGCGSPRTRSTLANPTVVIAGHSAGGGIVQGYPGKFPDVAAMIQGSYSNRGSGAVVTKQLTEVVVPSLARGEDYVPFFRSRRECEDFNVHRPGAVASVVRVACDPSKFVLTPAGVRTNIVALQQENDQFVKATGSIPVLLTYGDNDAAFPLPTAQADAAYWRGNCGCDVEEYIEPATGHLFMAHRSMTAWVDRVTSWLASKGIR